MLARPACWPPGCWRVCGVRVRIFDKTEQQAHESRAFGVHAKTLELMLNIGLVEEFMDRGLMASGVQFFVDGRRAAEINFADIGRDDTPYAFLLMVPQYDIEAILAGDLERQNVPIEHNVEVTGFTQSTDRVTVQARDLNGATFEIDCKYLIGADGAHSIVRKTLGLSFAVRCMRRHFCSPIVSSIGRWTTTTSSSLSATGAGRLFAAQGPRCVPNHRHRVALQPGDGRDSRRLGLRAAHVA